MPNGGLYLFRRLLIGARSKRLSEIKGLASRGGSQAIHETPGPTLCILSYDFVSRPSLCHSWWRTYSHHRALALALALSAECP
jgi:hypothetical protein